MGNGIKERLEQFIQSQQISNAEFERRCGLGNGYVKNFKSSIGSEKLVSILRTYPNLDLYWLLTGDERGINQQVTGEGNTQVAGNHNHIDVAHEAIAALRSQLDVKDGQIDKLLGILANTSK